VSKKFVSGWFRDVDTHVWTVDAADTDRDGVRFEVTPTGQSARERHSSEGGSV
jgi:hypothetical protein